MRDRLFFRTLLALFLGSFAAPAQPPMPNPEPTPEQKQLQAEAAKWGKETAALRKAGKLTEAIQAAEKMLAAELNLYGELHDAPMGLREQIGQIQEELGQYDASKQTRQKVLELQTRRFGKDDWRVTDARVALETLDVVSKLDAAGRKELASADARNIEGVVESRKGNHRAAEPLYLQAKAIRRKVLGENHPDYAITLNNLAGLYASMGQFSKAEALLLEARSIRQKVLGENHLDYADSLRTLAFLYASMGQPAKAEPLYVQAKSIQRRVLGEGHPEYAETLNSLASLYQNLGLYAKAEPLLLEAKAIRGRMLGENDPEYAATLNSLAVLYRAMGQPAKVEPLLLEAKSIRRRVLGEGHPDYAQSLNSLALLYAAMGQPAKAEPLLLEAKSIRGRVLGEDHPDYAGTLNNLGTLYVGMGQPAKAEPFFVLATHTYRKALGESHPDYATSLNNLAKLYNTMGHPAKAEPLYLQANAIYQKVLGENHPDYARSLNYLAVLYKEMGQPGKAEPLYLKAKSIRQKVLGENHPDYATSLNSLGLLYEDLDQPAKAEPLLLEAKSIRGRVLGENHPDYAASLNNLGALYIRLGQHAKSEPFFVLAKQTYQKMLGENHPNYATSLNNLAELYRELGQPARAEPLLLEAKAIRQRVFGENHPEYAESLNNLAYLYAVMGHSAKAEPLYFQAVNIITTHLERTSEVQTEAAQLLMAQKNRPYWENLLHGTAKNASPAVYEPLFRIRGAITARQTFLQALRQTTPEVKPLVEQLQAVAGEMSRLVNVPPDPKLKIDLPQKLAELTVRYEQLQRELAAKSDAFAAYQKKKKATPADLQKLLPANAVLIDFLGYKDQLCAFLVTPKAIVRVELGAMKPIADAIDLFREQLTRREPLTGKPDDPALVLREKLWKPLMPAIGNAKLVLLCPDGALCRLPFAALPNADGSKYLIEELSIAVMPVPQQMFDLFAPQPEHNVGLSLLTMGDVDFDQSTLVARKPFEATALAPIRAGQPLQWAPLPGAKREVDAIADSFRSAVPDGAMTSLRGSEASQRALSEQLGRFRYVHLATHGYFSPKELTAKLRPTPQEERAMTLGERPRSPGLNPALMSGIVCAGANRPTPENSGVLTALEISELDLTHIELAILSACETGLGETAGGEGVFGLQRAFQLAGARTTVTSLWKISDGATQEMMTRYYANRFQKKLGSLAALQETQLWMLQEGVGRGIARGMTAVPEETDVKGKRSPPIYWAAFSLAGDWR